MFLKSLTLKGFKSFADTTTLELEPGITVVVGPNGSGKSNVVDAVAWVLGAQGPRTVRSGKMEDVIFAGTAKRPALGRAEVTLTIDNSSGLLPIDFSEVTITRTLWHSGDSEYAINGVSCRLLDVQELLSDSGVGRQQHVIVGQGQLDAVLNAQTTDRRLIIEEAAGVLKYRRRREKAQRRLEATEGNLLRVQDLLREVRRQLRPLERQADAARRYGDVVGSLSAIRLYLAGRELTSLKRRAEHGAATRTEVAAAERSVIATLGRLDADVLAAEASLSAAGDSGLGDVLGRFEGLRERARGLAAVLAERQRSVERLRGASLDQDLIASLESEATALVAELGEVELEAERVVPRVVELESAEAELAEELLAFGGSADASPAGPEVPAGAQVEAGPGASEVRGELSALRAGVARALAERERLEGRMAALRDKADRLASEADGLRAELADADAAEVPLAEALENAAADRAVGEGAVAGAEQVLADADGAHRAWTARAEALALALDEARARAGAERLAEVGGLVGTLLDVVDVDDGWQPAFEAAIGEAVASVVVADVDAARRALAHLQSLGTSGAVLALGELPGLSEAALAGIDASPSIDSVAQPVRAHVRSTIPAVGALLDRLLVGVVCVDGSWDAALDVALAHPALVVVTRHGDRFAATGWRSGTGSVGATGAALDEARQRATQTAAEAGGARLRLEQAQGAAAAARTAEAEAARALDRHDSRRNGAADGLQRAEADRREVATEAEAVGTQMAELVGRLEGDEIRVAELEALLPELEADEAAGAARAAAVRAARSRLDQRQAALRALRTDLEVRIAGLDERRSLLTRRRDEVEARLARHLVEREGAQRRREELEGQSLALSRLVAVAADRLTLVDGRLFALRDERRQQSEQVHLLSQRLEQLRRDRAAAERELTGLRERAQRAELDDAETRLRLETATENLRREFDCEPGAAMAAECPELPPGTTADHRARELERELRLMGPINPLALEEHTALAERHTFLESQLEDVKNSRRELAKVIRAIDSEIVDVFSAAYADVADNFGKLFSTLFPGGTGRLRLTDPDNLLDTGVEVEARPSGKNVKRLSLLSGGERSLTAMAFLFAVFRSRPSPFYLMDEVEAALDDVNLHRFLDLIREFRDEAQLVIVSHQKRTMEAADCLFGITMQPAGSSKVVSERVGAGA
ncbi:MAG TPA: chromosome segregation protein SMC [Acidimicrobiales bacterium]|nr:chromosome segregation protein SMC [Acidimicrobiales bacterium]